MSTTRQNLDDLTRGDDLTVTVTYTADGDISAAQVSATWRDQSGAAVFTRRNLAAGGGAAQIAMLSASQFAIYIVPANTSGLAIGEGGAVTLRYDVQVTTAAGLVHTILQGTHTIVGDVTR